MAPLLFFFLSLSLVITVSAQPPLPSSTWANSCGETCGRLSIPSPFHINPSCGPNITAFALLCPTNSTYPVLTFSATPSGEVVLPILAFLPAGRLLVDYSSSNSCYADLTNPAFQSTPFFAVTSNNVLRLYHCDDSSLCTTTCSDDDDELCEQRDGGGRGCCYSLSEGGAWREGDGLAEFAKSGCSGFSSSVENKELESGNMVRGVEVEWALPRRYRNGTVCSDGAVTANATAVAGGVRCSCPPGYLGDGFADGSGCTKTCTDEDHTSNGRGCCAGRLCRKQIALLTGILISVIVLLAIAGLWLLFRRHGKKEKHNYPEPFLPRILPKAYGTRLFTYQELNEATNGFEEDHKLVGILELGTVHTGVLQDGSLVAVQRINSESQQNLKQVLERGEIFTHISHKNIIGIVGFCIESGFNLLLVYEFFFNRTLAELLRVQEGINHLSWYKRINIATEVASALTYLQYDLSPPVYLYGLNSKDIFIDNDFSVKVSGFKFLINAGRDGKSCSSSEADSSNDSQIVHCFGLILLELIIGHEYGDISIALNKINDRDFHEIVDKRLKYSEEMTHFQREQIERIACLASQCLSAKGNERRSMVGVAQELVRICSNNNNNNNPRTNNSILQETFSSSSLLQMISTSPDSLHAQSDGIPEAICYPEPKII